MVGFVYYAIITSNTDTYICKSGYIFTQCLLRTIQIYVQHVITGHVHQCNKCIPRAYNDLALVSLET